jgi:hypothetical protein
MFVLVLLSEPGGGGVFVREPGPSRRLKGFRAHIKVGCPLRVADQTVLDRLLGKGVATHTRTGLPGYKVAYASWPSEAEAQTGDTRLRTPLPPDALVGVHPLLQPGRYKDGPGTSHRDGHADPVVEASLDVGALLDDDEDEDEEEGADEGLHQDGGNDGGEEGAGADEGIGTTTADPPDDDDDMMGAPPAAAPSAEGVALPS